jgi:hypothetical protein
VIVARGGVVIGGAGTVRVPRRASGTLPGCPINAGDGCRPGGRGPGGWPGARGGIDGGCGAVDGDAPGTAIGRATPGGGTCVRVGWFAKLLRTVGSTCATTGATGRLGTSALPGTTLTAPLTPWFAYSAGLVGGRRGVPGGNSFICAAFTARQ